MVLIWLFGWVVHSPGKTMAPPHLKVLQCSLTVWLKFLIIFNKKEIHIVFEELIHLPQFYSCIYAATKPKLYINFTKVGLFRQPKDQKQSGS